MKLPPASLPNSSPSKAIFTAQNLEIFLLYFLMFAGGLWHILNVLQTAMRLLSAPMVFMLALWVAFRYDQTLRQHAIPGEKPTLTSRLHWWNIIVAISCFTIEFIGVKTGWIFGRYSYTEVWIPAFRGVPIAISFAWLGMLLTSFGLVQRFAQTAHSIWLRAFFVAVLMTIFDVFMEPVAVKLHYWQWTDTTGNPFFVAPVQNYLAWFTISYALAYGALRVGLFGKPTMPRVAFHGYWAQLLYFAMVALGKA
jgi:putative membrane protein